MTGKVILIDAYSQIFRSFFAVRALSNSKGEPTNAVFVFTRLLLHIEKEYPSREGAMLFDCGKVGFRMELNPEYKANRPPMPDDLRRQIPVIREMAEAFGWPLLEEPEYEADDLIGAFTVAAGEAEVRIVSSDKDLAQLVNDRVRLLSPAQKGGGFDERGPEEIEAKFQVPPSLMVDYLALLGDSSDNIGGVPGIGAKGAAELLKSCGSSDKWLEEPALLAGTKFEKKLLPELETFRRNRELIRLRADLPERFRDLGAVLRRRNPDWNHIARLCRELELKSLLKELPVPAEEEEPAPPLPEDDLFSALTPPVAPPKEEEGKGEMVQGELF